MGALLCHDAVGTSEHTGAQALVVRGGSAAPSHGNQRVPVGSTPLLPAVHPVAGPLWWLTRSRGKVVPRPRAARCRGAGPGRRGSPAARATAGSRHCATWNSRLCDPTMWRGALPTPLQCVLWPCLSTDHRPALLGATSADSPQSQPPRRRAIQLSQTAVHSSGAHAAGTSLASTKTSLRSLRRGVCHLCACRLAATQA